MDYRLIEFVNWANSKKKACPKIADEIQDFVQLAIDEIEEGKSINHEIELSMNDIEELINDNCN